MRKLKSYINKYRRLKTINYLKQLDSVKLLKWSEKKLIKTLKKNALKIPAYKNILNKSGINVENINTIHDFKKHIPVIDKIEVFNNYSIKDLCIPKSVNSIKNIYSSSSYSGNPSFGIDSSSDIKKVTKAIDTSLEYLFNISEKKTLLINCLPMGVKVLTSVTIAETSVRSDCILAIIKKFSDYFEQLVIIGNPYFVKKLIEEGVQENVNWKKLNTNLILGEEWFPESFRIYLEKLIGIEDHENESCKAIGVMGITELDLNLFHESSYTIKIRKLAQENAGLKEKLFGQGVKAVPELFHYFPNRFYLESLQHKSKHKQLVFSMLKKDRLIPLIRYNSKDIGEIHSYNQIKEILLSNNLHDYIPDLKLPLVSVKGRINDVFNYKYNELYIGDIKQGIYENEELARNTTGFFRITFSELKPLIEIQLNKNSTGDKKTENLFQEFCNKYIPVELPVKLYTYFEFPYAMDLNYERKFKFL